MDWLWAGYQLGIIWLWLSYGLTISYIYIGWLWAGYWLSMGWPWGSHGDLWTGHRLLWAVYQISYQLAMGYPSAGYGLSIVWLSYTIYQSWTCCKQYFGLECVHAWFWLLTGYGPKSIHFKTVMYYVLLCTTMYYYVPQRHTAYQQCYYIIATG